MKTNLLLVALAILLIPFAASATEKRSPLSMHLG